MSDNDGVMGVLQRMALKEERCLTGLEPCGTDEPCPACLCGEMVSASGSGAARGSFWPRLPMTEWQFAPLDDARVHITVYPLIDGHTL